mmetsp:Transcript_69326/g.186775  ORF Transcript_69326/g.186775 Transcript_69326/m.186775 type:complete len:214 (+) Transcript_69326:470-1111(+)
MNDHEQAHELLHVGLHDSTPDSHLRVLFPLVHDGRQQVFAQPSTLPVARPNQPLACDTTLKDGDGLGVGDRVLRGHAGRLGLRHGAKDEREHCQGQNADLRRHVHGVEHGHAHLHQRREQGPGDARPEVLQPRDVGREHRVDRAVGVGAVVLETHRQHLCRYAALHVVSPVGEQCGIGTDHHGVCGEAQQVGAEVHRDLYFSRLLVSFNGSLC